MNIKIITAFFTILFSVAAIAAQAQAGRQHHNPENLSKSWEVMQAYKISYLENNLNLTEEEGEKFWPQYHEYERKKKKIFKEIFAMMPERGEINKLTDEEIKGLILKKLEYDQELLDLEKEFYQDMFKILPVRKIAEYFKGEREYKRYLIDRMPPGPGKHP